MVSKLENPIFALSEDLDSGTESLRCSGSAYWQIYGSNDPHEARGDSLAQKRSCQPGALSCCLQPDAIILIFLTKLQYDKLWSPNCSGVSLQAPDSQHPWIEFPRAGLQNDLKEMVTLGLEDNVVTDFSNYRTANSSIAKVREGADAHCLSEVETASKCRISRWAIVRSQPYETQ